MTELYITRVDNTILRHALELLWTCCTVIFNGLLTVTLVQKIYLTALSKYLEIYLTPTIFSLRITQFSILNHRHLHLRFILVSDTSMSMKIRRSISYVFL
jgi:hypothetical protein